MLTLLWASPLLAVVLLLASGRADTVRAGLAGAVLALVVGASGFAPQPLSVNAALAAAGKGAWLAFLAGSVILGGLFFHLAGAQQATGTSGMRRGGVADRRALFAACFLIGPFVESATGFGVGYVVALGRLAALGLPPLPMAALGLFSQALVPWGALAIGTVVGAALGGLPPAGLGLRSAVLTLPLLAAWLPLYWRLADAAGLPAGWAERAREAGWLAALGLLLIPANFLLGAEVAAVAALGPLLVLRFWRDARPDAAGWLDAARATAPYVALSALLIAGRAVPPLHALFARVLVVPPPFAGLPAYAALLHPLLFLLGVPIVAALLAGRPAVLARAAGQTWRRGWKAAGATLLFLVMAQFIDMAGIARALAAALLGALGPVAAVLAVPIFAGAAGLLTSSNTASNGLFMPSLAALAQAAGLDRFWLAAVQNTSGSALTMLSPIRVALGCAVVGRLDLERKVYRLAWKMGAAALAAMLAAAGVVAWAG